MKRVLAFLLFANLAQGAPITYEDVTLQPAAEEELAFGPQAVASTREGDFVLDGLGRQALYLVNGEIKERIPVPPGCVGLIADDEQIVVWSVINHEATRISRKTNKVLEHVELPLAFDYMGIEARGEELLLRGAYQNSYSLGVPGARRLWPDMLLSQEFGNTSHSGGPRLQVSLREGAGVMTIPAPKGAGTSVPLEGAKGLLSIIYLDSFPSGSFAVVEERQGATENDVTREIVWYSAQGKPIARVQPHELGIYSPVSEFSTTLLTTQPESFRVSQLLPTEEGIEVLHYNFTEGGVK